MRVLLCAAVAVLLGSVPAFAADEMMNGFYGNTVVVTGDGFAGHVHYRADHTMDMSGTASGKAFSTTGSWKIDENGRMCRTFKNKVPTMPNPFCNAAVAHKVGDTWTARTATGSARNIALVAGIQ